MPEPRFTVGDQVRLRSSPSKVGMIAQPALMMQGQYWYPVFFGGGGVQRHPEEDLEPYAGTSDIRTMLEDGRFEGREELSRLVAHLKLTVDLRSQIYSLFASRTHFFPYQFKPLLKFLESRNHRLLIADEVGLGKTIEAGLILTELRRRADLRRVLVVPPAHLRRKWQEEMRKRFDRHFQILDREALHEFLRTYQREGVETELWGIVSLQTLRGRRVREHWEEVGPELDFVVFDEAGRLRNRKTLSHRSATLVAETADALILLTATPVQTGTDDLFHLLRILDPDEFERKEVFEEQLHANGYVLAALSALRDPSGSIGAALEHLRGVEHTSLATRFRENPIYCDLLERLPRIDSPTHRERVELQRDVAALSVFGHMLSRTRKREVHENQVQRRSQVLRRGPTLDEAEFYSEVTRICRDAYQRATDQRGQSFGVMQPQRQMASCMVAMVGYLEARLRDELEAEDSADVQDEPDAPEAEDPSDLRDDGDAQGDSPNDRPRPRWSELGDLDVWRQRLLARDTKLEALLQILRDLDAEEPGAKVIVFTFFRRTVSYLARCLREEGMEVLTLTGATPTNPDNPEDDERQIVIERFRNDPRIRVLIATEVADEGLDLQFAHCMVNYDLPWNPMRIEQRIGRIDRIGQASPHVTIVNLAMTGTIEERILELLFERIGIFEQSIGDLETILGDVIENLQRDLFSRDLSRRELDERIQEAAGVVESKRQMLETLQSRAEALIGHDEFFLDEIERARSRRRYLSGEELLIYLRDFLASQPAHRACRIRSVEDRPNVFELKVSEALRLFVRAALPQGSKELARFLSRSASGDMLFTTDGELAEQDPRLEFLTFYHPLVTAVTHHYEENGSELHPVSCVRLETAQLPPGRYAWFLYLIEITGARPQRDLQLAALCVPSGEALSEDQCEALLWEMIAHSESMPQALRDGVPRALVDAAEELATERLDARFDQLRRANEALVANRLASLRETFERNLHLRQERLARAQARNRRESYIRGLETGLRNLQSMYEQRTAEIEQSRRMGRSYQLRGGGVVEVSRGG